MKKLFAVLLIVALALAAGAWLLLRSSPERELCTRTWQLCKVGNPRWDNLDKCVQDVGRMRDALGDESLERSVTCVKRANSCAGAMGCLAGGAFDNAKKAFGDFVEGFSRGRERR